MQKEGLWNGKDDITFFGERPLGGPDGVFVRFSEGSNINILHEHAFGIENGRLDVARLYRTKNHATFRRLCSKSIGVWQPIVEWRLWRL
jgi:hypothetical protein